MAQPDPRSPKGNRPPNGGGNASDPNFNWRGIVLFAIAIALIGGAIFVKGNPYGTVRDVSYPAFKDLLEKDQIDKAKGIELVHEQSMGTHFLRAKLRPGTEAVSANADTMKVQVDLQYM